MKKWPLNAVTVSRSLSSSETFQVEVRGHQQRESLAGEFVRCVEFRSSTKRPPGGSPAGRLRSRIVAKDIAALGEAVSGPGSHPASQR